MMSRHPGTVADQPASRTLAELLGRGGQSGATYRSPARGRWPAAFSRSGLRRGAAGFQPLELSQQHREGRSFSPAMGCSASRAQNDVIVKR